MRRKLTVGVVLAVLIGLVVGAPAFAKRGKRRRKPRIARAYLVPPDCEDFGKPDRKGPWGRIRYNTSGETLDFTFSGRRLTPGTKYGLYSQGQLLGSKVANRKGRAALSGSANGQFLEGGRFELWRVEAGFFGTPLAVEQVLWSAPHGFDYTGAAPPPM